MGGCHVDNIFPNWCLNIIWTWAFVSINAPTFIWKNRVYIYNVDSIELGPLYSMHFTHAPPTIIKKIYRLKNIYDILIHTHTYIYIYMCVCSLLFSNDTWLTGHVAHAWWLVVWTSPLKKNRVRNQRCRLHLPSWVARFFSETPEKRALIINVKCGCLSWSPVKDTQAFKSSNLELVLRHFQISYLVLVVFTVRKSSCRGKADQDVLAGAEENAKFFSGTFCFNVDLWCWLAKFHLHTESYKGVFGTFLGTACLFSPCSPVPCYVPSFGTAQVECIAKQEGKLNCPRSDLTWNSHLLDGIATWIPLLHRFASVDRYLCPKETKRLIA